MVLKRERSNNEGSCSTEIESITKSEVNSLWEALDRIFPCYP